jgi:3-deoxy-D-manno-octulosonate 8-phosphate phosphatase KdsC-like HAD superfamily phosphatase
VLLVQGAMRPSPDAYLMTLLRLLNVPPKRIATIGDMPNDILMFRKSGVSIAMGYASDQVKMQADLVTDSNDNEGFAKQCRGYSREEPKVNCTDDEVRRCPAYDLCSIC